MSAVDRNPRKLYRTVPRLLLIAIPIFVLPLAILTLCYNYAANILKPRNDLRRRIRQSSRFRPQTVLITGITTPAGLRVARALYQTGHIVIGVTDSQFQYSSHAGWSRSVSRLYKVRMLGTEVEYTKDLLYIVVAQRVNMWIDCSDIANDRAKHAQAKQKIEKNTSCVCLAPDAAIVDKFASRHSFQAFVQDLGLHTLETHRVKSRNDVHNVLREGKGKKFVLSGPNGLAVGSQRAVLPRRTPSQTYQDVSQLKITKGTPWILEQHIEGLATYSTCSIVVFGKVKAFVAFSYTDGGLETLPPTASLAHAMRSYMEEFASRMGDRITSHVTMDFCVEEKPTNSGVVQQTLPIEGRLAANSALALFAGKKGSIDLTKAYLAALAPSLNGLSSFTGLPFNNGEEGIVEPDINEDGLYYLDQNLYSLVLVPLFRLATFDIGIRTCFETNLKFVNQLCHWREAAYEFWDPLPAFWLYLTYTRTNMRRWLKLAP